MSSDKDNAHLITKFNFRRIDVTSRSAISVELASDCRKGIYFYEFSDGSSYVGKSVDMVRRHADHLHEYKHRVDFDGLKIDKAYFMTVDENTTNEELDNLETAVVQQAELDGFNLRNLQKTNIPAGNSNYVLEFNENKMRLLPWRREDRTTSLPPTALQSVTINQTKRFEKLLQTENSQELLRLVSKYVFESITEPANTVCIYWSVTTFPQRKNGPSPILRITCGTLETLTIWFDKEGYCGFANIRRPEHDEEEIPALAESIREHGYTATNNVISAYFLSLEQLKEMLENPRFLDWCYRLNIEMFRHCKNPQAKFTNALLAKAILKK